MASLAAVSSSPRVAPTNEQASASSGLRVLLSWAAPANGEPILAALFDLEACLGQLRQVVSGPNRPVYHGEDGGDVDVDVLCLIAQPLDLCDELFVSHRQ